MARWEGIQWCCIVISSLEWDVCLKYHGPAVLSDAVKEIIN